MRVALLIENFDPARGGRETSVAQTAVALQARGHHVVVLCMSGNDEGLPFEVRPLGRGRGGRVARLKAYVAAAQNHLADDRFDVTHATLPVPGVDIYQPRGGTVPGQLVAGRRRWGWLAPLRKHLIEPLNAMRRDQGQLEAEVMADPSVYSLAVSRMVAEEFAHHYGRTDRVRVVYNAVTVPEVSEERRAEWRQETRFRLKVGPEDPVFVTAATNFGLKGISEAIRAFGRFRHRQPGGVNPRLVVIGRDVVEGYQRLAGLHDVGSDVVFMPPTREMFRWYSAADVAVLLSWYDPCSRVVLEALRWGLPAITTAFNGAAEVLVGGAGRVVDRPDDLAAVADAMDHLASRTHRQAAGPAIASLDEQLSMDRHVDELLEVYRQVAGGRS